MWIMAFNFQIGKYINDVIQNRLLTPIFYWLVCQWRNNPTFFGGGGAKRTAMAWDSKIWNLDTRKCDLKHFGGEILQNSEDYKVHQRPDISLEMSPWKTGRGVRVSLFSFCAWCRWCVCVCVCGGGGGGGGGMGGRSQCDFDRKFCIYIILWDAFSKLLFIRYRINIFNAMIMIYMTT